MSDQQYFSGFDSPRQEDSRSQKKRDAQVLRRLVEETADLGAASFERLDLPDDLQAALVEARRLKPCSDERRRQLQFCAKVLRSCVDEVDLRAQIDSLDASAREDPKALRLENLRLELIDSGKAAIDSLCGLLQDIDRNKLRALVKNAQQESLQTLQGAPKPQARVLYQYLKAQFLHAKIEIPTTLLS